jgi:hypothetical protein
MPNSTDEKEMKGFRWLGRFLYALAWPLGLCYAFLLGQSWHACMPEVGRLFGWAFFLWVLTAMFFWPAALAVVCGSAVAASFMRPAVPGAWPRRFAWLAGAMLVVVAVAAVALSGVLGPDCHLNFM